MPHLDHWLLVATFIGLVLGVWSIAWARTHAHRSGVLIGRTIFVANLVTIGGSSMLAAFHRADGLLPLGFLAGALVVGMLWECP